MGYTKLFTEIIMSTVWREPNHVRLLWITMLALKDRWHIVNASIPGLADSARITLEECESAIHVLSSPDPYSRTKDFEGRRIVSCEGGWEVLNGEKYRNKMSVDERREYNRIKQKEYRDRQKGIVKSCVQSSTQCTHTDTKEDTKELKIKTLEQSFKVFWSAYPKKRNIEQARKAWNKLKPGMALLESITLAVEKARQTEDWRKDKGQYIPYPSTWLNAKGWLDEYEVSVETINPKPTGKLARAVQAINEHHAEKDDNRTITEDAGKAAGLLPSSGRTPASD